MPPSGDALTGVSTDLPNGQSSKISDITSQPYEPYYRLLIIGGGPSGCSIISRAIRINLYKELLEANGESLGTCIVDKENRSRFGGGKLQDYIVNSNTYGSKFATNITCNKDEVIPKETISNTTFASLKDSLAGRELELCGDKPAPLMKVGNFLRDVGQCVIDTLSQYPTSCAYHTDTTVLSIAKYPIKSLKKDSADDTSSQCNCLWQVNAIGPSGPLTLYTKVVALANGGAQEPPKLSNSEHMNKLFTSDNICTGAGLDDLKMKLKGTSKKRIVIVGGSHSAFSAAWICLNKLEIFQGIDNSNASSPIKASTADSIAEKYSICILHRSPIQVFYASKKDADSDRYTDIGPINKSTGQIHPFGGLRGDAKELWRNIRLGRETRVKLVKTNNATTIINKMYDDAAVIIWACGYSTNTIPLLDENNNPIKYKLNKGQIEVDENANVLMEKLNDTGDSLISCPIPNLYGSGLGYGLKATFDNGELDGSSGRADGVAVYLKRGAALILAAVLGNAVFGGSDIKSWEERCELIKKMNREKDGTPSADNSCKSSVAAVDSSSKALVSNSSTPLSTPERRRKSCTNAVSTVRKSCDDPPPYTVAVAKFKDELDQLQSSNRLSAPKKLSQSIDNAAIIKTVKKVESSSKITKISEPVNSTAARDDPEIEAARNFLSSGVFPSVKEVDESTRPNSSSDKTVDTAPPLSPHRPNTSVCSTRQYIASSTSMNSMRQANNQYFLSPIKIKPKRLSNGTSSGNKASRSVRPEDSALVSEKPSKVYQKTITSFSFELPQIKSAEFPVALGTNNNTSSTSTIATAPPPSLGSMNDSVKVNNMITYEEFKKHIQSQKNGPGRSLLRNDGRLNLVASVVAKSNVQQGSAHNNAVLAWK